MGDVPPRRPAVGRVADQKIVETCVNVDVSGLVRNQNAAQISPPPSWGRARVGGRHVVWLGVTISSAHVSNDGDGQGLFRMKHKLGRHLRKNMSDAEERLWSRLRRRPMQGCKF